MRQSNEIKSKPQDTDPKSHSQLLIHNHDRQSQAAGYSIGPDLTDRIEKLEDKIDAFIVSHFSASKLTSNTGSTVRNQQTPGGKGVDACSQTDAYLYENYTEGKRQRSFRLYNEDQNVAEQMQAWMILAAEIDRLVKSNNKICSCIDALGSSGLIDLIEILGNSVGQLHSEIASLRKQQSMAVDSRDNLHIYDDNDSKNNFQQRRKQLEIPANAIQRLLVLLGRREEQLQQEKKATERSNRKIDALEEMIKVLEVEWQKIMPLVSKCNSED